MKILIHGNTVLAAQADDFIDIDGAFQSGGVVIPLGAIEGYVVIDADLPAGCSAGDCEYVDGEVRSRPAPRVVPDEVPAQKAVRILHRRGYLKTIYDYCDSLGVEGVDLRLKIDRSQVFQRHDPLLVSMARNLLQLTDEQIDQLFIDANALDQLDQPA